MLLQARIAMSKEPAMYRRKIARQFDCITYKRAEEKVIFAFNHIQLNWMIVAVRLDSVRHAAFSGQVVHLIPSSAAEQLVHLD